MRDCLQTNVKKGLETPVRVCDVADGQNSGVSKQEQQVCDSSVWIVSISCVIREYASKNARVFVFLRVVFVHFKVEFQ